MREGPGEAVCHGFQVQLIDARGQHSVRDALALGAQADHVAEDHERDDRADAHVRIEQKVVVELVARPHGRHRRFPLCTSSREY